ncbi:phosphate/phosphite/phosphonate ABC transporter substrate-binding protein [Thalassotalea sp. M1531]|uniref:Phosphate/phosphite/phosphonate ABC transporter substrate-binding protein n=1 Tax=Thalassotalea algicola TaxID=2716224 RepID=A0A7Y0L9T1_9GAMM|nr:phosphate/phosphite/phosphonate ABC transporter substrate-binding protein [Thalassotalea algicola]NMP30248.1 phosphate/phosphite/phosphonate ABC transporter substrate-binding protein [Thalassotalea algicola]
MLYKWTALAALLMLLFAVASCNPLPKKAEQPKQLVIGLLPDREPEQLMEVHQPLLAFISAKLAVDYKVVIPANYDDFIDKFEKNKIDLALFGGVTFIKASNKNNAIPLAMRNIDLNFVSYLIVRRDSELTNLRMLKGKSFAFGSSLSTSGHIMPRFYMKRQGITPEEFFSSVIFSGSHTETINMVVNREVAAGVLNSQVYETMLTSKPAIGKQLMVIRQSPPYPDYVWAIQPNFDEEFNQKIIDAFLSITSETETGKAILSKQSAEAFYPASIEDFDELKQALMLIEMKED